MSQEAFPVEYFIDTKFRFEFLKRNCQHDISVFIGPFPDKGELFAWRSRFYQCLEKRAEAMAIEIIITDQCAISYSGNNPEYVYDLGDLSGFMAIGEFLPEEKASDFFAEAVRQWMKWYNLI